MGVVFWRCIVVLVASVGLTACSLTRSESRVRPTDLVTRTSLGGIHLQDPQGTVEAIYGKGKILRHPGAVTIHYPAGLTSELQCC
jgi:hypothetical protein